jgi:hypothetical protein
MMKNIDELIRYELCAGTPAEAIATKLDIPVEWVAECAEYMKVPVAIIDLPTIQGMN